MKIRYNLAGNINACALDNAPLSGEAVARVADNDDLMRNLEKYAYFNGVLSLRPYLKIASAMPVVEGTFRCPANSSVCAFMVTAYNPDGTVVAGANFPVVLRVAFNSPFPSASSLDLKAGVADFTLNSGTVKAGAVRASAFGYYDATARVIFS